MHVSGTGKHVCLSTSQTLGGGEHRPSQMKVAPRPQQLPGEVRGAQSGWSSPSPVRPPPQDEHVDVGSPENASWGANQYPDGDRASLLPLEPTRRQGGASATPGFAHSPSRRSVPQGRPGERSLMLTQTTPASPDAVPKGKLPQLCPPGSWGPGKSLQGSLPLGFRHPGFLSCSQARLVTEAPSRIPTAWNRGETGKLLGC